MLREGYDNNQGKRNDLTSSGSPIKSKGFIKDIAEELCKDDRFVSAADKFNALSEGGKKTSQYCYTK